MTKLLSVLSNNLVILETEGNPQAMGQRNPNQFRRPFNSRILNKEIRNEDPPIHPPITPYDQCRSCHRFASK